MNSENSTEITIDWQKLVTFNLKINLKINKNSYH